MTTGERQYKVTDNTITVPYFDDAYMAEKPTNEYVCWIDIMGTQNKMFTSMKQCAIFIFKLHIAVLEAIKNEGAGKGKGDVITYPVMDGVYLTSKKRNTLLRVVNKIFSAMATMFLEEKKFYNLYLIKGAIAYGPVYHGKDVQNGASNILNSNEKYQSSIKEYQNSILIGMPMVQAFLGEKSAPPFGLFVDETARAFCDPTEHFITSKWYRWDKTSASCFPKNRVKDFIDKVNKYFDQCEKIALSIDYPIHKIQEHKEAFNMYFAKVQDFSSLLMKINQRKWRVPILLGR